MTLSTLQAEHDALQEQVRAIRERQDAIDLLMTMLAGKDDGG